MKAPSCGASETDDVGAKKPFEKQVREENLQSRVISVIWSNGDHDDEENDSSSEDLSGSSTDYCYLIVEE